MGVDGFEISQDAVLGGRLQLRQPVSGHRVGHDAILLAAATGGIAGEHAVDLGAGVGAAGLALAARIAGLNVTLIEIDAALCELAAGNATLNHMADRVRALSADVEDSAALAAAGLSPGGVDRVLMNPPFNNPARQNVSPDPLRRLAHAGPAGLLARWVAAAAWLLKPHGVLTLIWRADGLDDVLEALKPAFGSVVVLPVFPRLGAPPIRVLVRAVKAGEAAQLELSGLVLNDPQGRPTLAAERVMRHVGTLGLAEL
jgi:tRNA1(Val) A37 N6-methylase TrmN6